MEKKSELSGSPSPANPPKRAKRSVLIGAAIVGVVALAAALAIHYQTAAGNGSNVATLSTPILKVDGSPTFLPMTSKTGQLTMSLGRKNGADDANLIATLDTASDSIHATSLGKNVYAELADPGHHRVYVRESGRFVSVGKWTAATVKSLDSETMSSVGALTVGADTAGMALDSDSNTLLVVDNGGMDGNGTANPFATVIDANTMIARATIRLPAGTYSRPIVDPRSHVAFVPSHEALQVIDLSGAVLRGSISVENRGSMISAPAMAYSPTANQILVGNASNDSISIIDGNGLRVIKTISGVHGLDAIAADPASSVIYAVGNSSTDMPATLTVADTSTGQVIRTDSLDTVMAMSAALSEDRQTLYVADYYRNNLLKVSVGQ